MMDLLLSSRLRPSICSPDPAFSALFSLFVARAVEAGCHHARVPGGGADPHRERLVVRRAAA
eukprot:6214359-Pleurochrysis_carterae.AAC.5